MKISIEDEGITVRSVPFTGPLNKPIYQVEIHLGHMPVLMSYQEALVLQRCLNVFFSKNKAATSPVHAEVEKGVSYHE